MRGHRGRNKVYPDEAVSRRGRKNDENYKTVYNFSDGAFHIFRPVRLCNVGSQSEKRRLRKRHAYGFARGFIERGIETEEQLEAAVEESLKDYNTDWTIVQVKLKDISRTDEAFILDFKLARIQNLHNVGRYELETGSDFLADSNTRNLLKKWSRGQFENLEYSNGKLVSSLAEDIKIYPVKYGSGEVIDAGRVYGKLSAGR